VSDTEINLIGTEEMKNEEILGKKLRDVDTVGKIKRLTNN